MMLFPQKGIDAIRALYKANPQDEPARKRDIQRVGEQMSFDLGNKWGNKKRAGLGDEFRSADSIAFLESDGTVSVWDIQSSAGVILVNAGDPPTFPNLPSSEATFMPCIPTDHMGGGTIPEPPPDDDIDEKLDQIIVTQQLILGILEQHTAKLDEINAKIGQGSGDAFPIHYPVYSGRFSFGTITLSPTPPMNP